MKINKDLNDLSTKPVGLVFRLGSIFILVIIVISFGLSFSAFFGQPNWLIWSIIQIINFHGFWIFLHIAIYRLPPSSAFWFFKR